MLLDSEGEVVQAHRMLGVAYLFENKPDDARREFRKLLELRPDYRFDPLLDPQRVVDFFNGVVKEEEATIAEIGGAAPPAREGAGGRTPAARAERLRMPPTVVRYERHSFAVNFIPFGAGQFQNGQRRKGWLFFGAEAVLGAVSVGAFATNFGLYGLAPHRRCNDRAAAWACECPPAAIDHSQEDTSRTLLGVQVVSGGAVLRRRDLGRHRRHRNYQPEVPLPDGAKVARGADVAGRASHVFARRPRRRLGSSERKPATMATLKFAVPGKGTKVYRIHKKITSLGRSEEADVTLPDPVLADSHAHIHFDGRDFNLATTEKDAELFVNGRKTQQAPAAARGPHPHRQRRDRVLAVRRAGHRRDAADRQVAELNSYKQAATSSRQKLMASYELPALLDQLLDVIIQVSQRRQGLPGADGVGRAGRQGRAQPPARDHLRRRPPAVGLDHRARRQDAASRSSSRDALNDDEFKNSLSVVNLKLTSVMCVPLLERGNMLGVIYVGNDNVAAAVRRSRTSRC